MVRNICLTDMMATFADISGYLLRDDEGEDSYSLLPALEGQQLSAPLREATVHHSINGNFAIRKDEWKLILCPGSGGWSAPKTDDPVIDSLPKLQLYHMSNDPYESKNLVAEHPEKVEELRLIPGKYITDGRSTPGSPQKNDDMGSEWEQISFMDE